MAVLIPAAGVVRLPATGAAPDALVRSGRRPPVTSFQASAGLVTADTLRLATWLRPSLPPRVWLGSRAFVRADPARFRPWTPGSLMALARLLGAQALGGLLGVPYISPR